MLRDVCEDRRRSFNFPFVEIDEGSVRENGCAGSDKRIYRPRVCLAGRYTHHSCLRQEHLTERSHVDGPAFAIVECGIKALYQTSDLGLLRTQAIPPMILIATTAKVGSGFRVLARIQLISSCNNWWRISLNERCRTGRRSSYV